MFHGTIHYKWSFSIISYVSLPEGSYVELPEATVTSAISHSNPNRAVRRCARPQEVSHHLHRELAENQKSWERRTRNSEVRAEDHDPCPRE